MLRALLIGGCLLLPALSLGANAPKPKEINIDDPGLIEGRNHWKPDVDDISTRQSAQFKSLIHLRDSFKDKVASSVSEL